jgi:hypothetical protein
MNRSPLDGGAGSGDVRLWHGLEALEAGYDVETVSTPSGVTHLSFTRS